MFFGHDEEASYCQKDGNKSKAANQESQNHKPGKEAVPGKLSDGQQTPRKGKTNERVTFSSRVIQADDDQPAKLVNWLADDQGALSNLNALAHCD